MKTFTIIALMLAIAVLLLAAGVFWYYIRPILARERRRSLSDETVRKFITAVSTALHQFEEVDGDQRGRFVYLTQKGYELLTELQGTPTGKTYMYGTVDLAEKNLAGGRITLRHALAKIQHARRKEE
jgi:hypothetical protein